MSPGRRQIPDDAWVAMVRAPRPDDRRSAAPMRRSSGVSCILASFAHKAILVVEPEADERVPGATVAVALCGHWDHEPLCPLSPHRVHADQVGHELHVGVLFAAEPETECEVRQRIDRALSGKWRFPDGFRTSWQLQESRPSNVSPDETGQAERLIRS
jgi:hypothetical protein